MRELKLNSVNFEHGMLLTPGHFLRQEEYVDHSLMWLLRYATNATGLVGAGPRASEADRGAVRHDEIVSVEDDGQTVTVAVAQCRGIASDGNIVEITPDQPVMRRFAKEELEGLSEAPIYLVCSPDRREVVDGALDEFNPQMCTERKRQYYLSLKASPQDQASTLIAGRIRRSRFSASFEKDADYIPPCTTMVSTSELYAGWKRLVDEIVQLTERYVELHRAMQEFLVVFKERGVETDLDLDSLGLVGRMVAALQQCIYDILDPVQPPARFFGYLRRFFHGASIYLDLSPLSQGYFEMLRNTGETDLTSLLESQRRMARTAFWLSLSDNLRLEIESALQNLSDLRKLERSLEGKYLDFRINRALEAMNFIFDRGGRVLFRLAGKPSRVQAVATDLILTMTQLHLEGRDKYRLIVVGEQNAKFEPGVKIAADIRINEGTGFRREPIHLIAESKLAEQCNFEFDFEVPDVPIITDIRVSLPVHFPIRTALLYVRQRFYGGAPSGDTPTAKELRSDRPDVSEPPQPPPPIPASSPEPPSYVRPYERPRTSVRLPDERKPAPFRAPWEEPTRPTRNADENVPPAPPRRRRLE